MDAADAVKQGVKANYPSEQWFMLAKQLRDPLRQDQRDALVSYLLARRSRLACRGGWAPTTCSPPPDRRRDVLFVATSRMVQATAAVQLLVQRCCLGLEGEVTVDAC